uniref:DUF6534 domain-containing protein n=1 Tax=Moniliophthora roreri TaxID=221103 RepID=A0A0W0G6F0_MONRR
MDTSSITVDPGSTFGSFLVTIILSSCLYGVTCLQTWYFFRHYNDRLLLRGVVLAILILETLHEIMAIHAVYYYLIINYANPLASLDIVWSVIGLIAVTDALNTIVHLFYTAQIYKISNKKGWWICVILCLLKMVQLVVEWVASSIYIMVGGVQMHSYMLYFENETLMTMAVITHTIAAAEDVICASAISYYLHKGRSGIKSTDTLINKLIVHAINNGALTRYFVFLFYQPISFIEDANSVVGICPLILMVSRQNNLLYTGTFTIVGKLYSNSILSTLNSRQYHKQIMLPTTVDTSSSSFVAGRNLDTTRSTYTADTHTTNMTRPEIQILVERQSNLYHYRQNDMELSDMKVNLA